MSRSKTVTSRFVLRGDNQLNSAFGKAKQQLTQIGKAAAVAGVAIGAMVARSVILNTIEQEKAVAQLNAALKSTGRFTPEASQALQDHAAALQQVSTYGDEAIIKGQNILLTFRNIGGEAFPRATQAVLDTATAMGVDLKSAAIQLGKALNDPKTQLSALSRSGITFSEEQKKMVNDMVDANNIAGAQALILEELETQFGGSAKAARDTFGGALEAVKNNFGDLLEVAGGDNGAIGEMNNLAELLASPDIKEGFQILAQGVFEFLSFLVQVPRALVEIKEDLDLLFGSSTINIRQAEEDVADLEALVRQVYEFEAKGLPQGPRLKTLQQELAEAREVLAALKREAKEPVEIMPPGERVSGSLGGGGPLDPEGTQGDADKIVKIIADLQKQVETFGLSKDGKALFKLIDQGATEEQIAQIMLIQNELRLLNEGQEVAKATAQARNTLEKEYADLIGSTRTAAENHHAQISRIDQMWAMGVIPTVEEYLALLERANDDFEGKTDEMTEFGIQAARNMETAFADFLFDPFDEGVKGMVEGFAKALQRMMADALAASILNSFFTALAGSSNAGVASFGSAMIGARASGGPVSAGGAYLVGEKGPEIIVPRGAGAVIPNNELGGSSVTVNIDARETDDPGRLLALVPVIQTQIEQSIALKTRRGYL